MISVVMVSYHTGPILWDSLASVLDAPDIEHVVLVDNGNDEGVVRQLKEREAADARLSVLTGHGNVGFAKACNLGADQAPGAHLLFLNPDAILPPGGGAALLEAGKVHGGACWVSGPRLENPDGSEQRGSRRAILTPWNAFVEASRLYRLMPNHPYFQRFNAHQDERRDDQIAAVPCLSGAAFLVPRATWDRLGGLDERYFLHVEDIDFFLRLRKAGGLALFVPSVSVTHHKSSSQVDPLFVERRKKQSLNLYFATHFQETYPPGFLTLIRGMLWTSFAFRSLTHRWRSRR